MQKKKVAKKAPPWLHFSFFFAAIHYVEERMQKKAHEWTLFCIAKKKGRILHDKLQFLFSKMVRKKLHFGNRECLLLCLDKVFHFFLHPFFAMQKNEWSKKNQLCCRRCRRCKTFHFWIVFIKKYSMEFKKFTLKFLNVFEKQRWKI